MCGSFDGDAVRPGPPSLKSSFRGCAQRRTRNLPLLGESDVHVFFRAPPGRAGNFLLLGQEKVTKEKATPRTRPEHIHVLRMRARPPGFADGTSLCLRRTGPHRARVRERSNLFSLALSEARMAVIEADLGPLCCGAGRTRRPEGWAQWIAPTCRRATDGASASPAGPYGFFVHGWTKNAAPGWPFS